MWVVVVCILLIGLIWMIGYEAGEAAGRKECREVDTEFFLDFDEFRRLHNKHADFWDLYDGCVAFTGLQSGEVVFDFYTHKDRAAYRKWRKSVVRDVEQSKIKKEIYAAISKVNAEWRDFYEE